MKRSHKITSIISCNLNNLLFHAKQHRKLQKYANYSNTHRMSYHSSSFNYPPSQPNQHYGNLNIVQFLQSHGLQENNDYKFRTYYTGNKQLIQLRECPLCPPHKNDITNLWTLGIFVDIGSWNCFRCSNHGNWASLIKIFNISGNKCGDAYDDYNGYNGYNGDIDYDNGDIDYDIDYDYDYIENEESEIEKISRFDYISEREINSETERLLAEKPLLNRLIKQRNLSSQCFADYKCGLKYKYFANLKEKQQCITFPMYQYSEKYQKFIATKCKTRCISNNIKQFAQYPIFNESGLFGFSNSNNNDNKNKIVITEGEFDCMAIYYATQYKIKPVSLPNGANNLSDPIIQQLTHFYDQFVLFLDWDDTGETNAKLLKDKIKNSTEKNINVKIVTNDNKLKNVKDANDILIKYRDESNDGHDIIKDIMHRYQME